ncbi:ATP-binding protein [Flavobacterium sandaracinum]|uniref:ATP-binding protein n=1 Tax=Flavobacterium sandaracinum TaxID=2541733 RepID=A0A4V2Z0R3_9FLAO|nr:ATP-binding protein [Flavobacterium sandaracinum]TDE02058.1 ATP-binding protein [Flavobacterium sandaracinum]
MISFNIPQNIHNRAHYIDRVKPFMGQNIIKVFTGQRRVGKSYLLFQLMQLLQEDPEKHLLYINKEDLAFSFIKTAEDLHAYVMKQKSVTGKTYVFIDEIQDIQDFEAALRSLLLREDLDLYCTGSNANLLSGDIAGHLSGRYIEIVVYSLSYSEFLDFHVLETSPDSLEKYLKYGGLPYLKHLPLEDGIVFEYLKNIYATIVYRDIINRYAVRNVPFLEQLVLFLAGHTGSVFSAKKISDFLKSQRVNMAPNQVQTYIQYLVNAFLVHKVARYDMIGKRIFEIGDKYYFENLGIRNGIWGYRIEDRGKILENAVFNHLLFKGFKVTVGKLNLSEIDFIAEKDGEKKYFQVTLTINDTKTLEREFGNLVNINDNYSKTVITFDFFSGNTYQGINTIDLEQFLLS